MLLSYIPGAVHSSALVACSESTHIFSTVLWSEGWKKIKIKHFLFLCSSTFPLRGCGRQKNTRVVFLYVQSTLELEFRQQGPQWYEFKGLLMKWVDGMDGQDVKMDHPERLDDEGLGGGCSLEEIVFLWANFGSPEWKLEQREVDKKWE